jgi:hypothetical protein
VASVLSTTLTLFLCQSRQSAWGKLRPHNRHQNQRAEIFPRYLATSHARCGESRLPGLLESEIMSHERLAVLMQAHLRGLRAHPEAHMPYEAILSILAGLNNGTINMGQVLRHLCSDAAARR